jgi:hypothetical protein
MAFDPSTCPSLTVLPSLGADVCTPDMDQVVGILFQKIQTTPSFTSTTILAQATWTPLMAAEGATKIIKSPLIHNLTIPMSEGVFSGGNDNSTAFGIREYKGEQNVTVTGNFKSTGSDLIDDVRTLSGDARIPGYTTIWAYFIGAGNRITAKGNGAGIPIYNFRVSTMGTEGYRSKNMYAISFDLRDNWDDDLKTFIASFDPTALVNA